MFSTGLVNNRPDPASMLAGFALPAAAVLVLLLLPFFLLEKLIPHLRVTAITLAQPPKIEPLRPAHVSPRPAHTNTAQPSTPQDSAPKPAPEPVSSSTVAGSITLQPDSPAWSAHVQHGQHVTFDIFAVDSFPVLRSLNVILVLDTSYPRGEALLFDLARNAAFHARIPHNVVVREIRGGVSGIPALDAARRLAEAELGAPPRLFSLWPADLYAALKSSTEAALRQASIAPETVRAAHVQLQMAGNRSFTLRLTKTHRT